MKRIATLTLLLVLAFAGSLSAKTERISPQENARRSSKAAKKQQKMLNKANKKQQKAAKKYAKAQRKQVRKANKNLQHRRAG